MLCKLTASSWKIFWLIITYIFRVSLYIIKFFVPPPSPRVHTAEFRVYIQHTSFLQIYSPLNTHTPPPNALAFHFYAQVSIICEILKMNVSKMPPLLSDIICGFARHITCTQVNILLLIYSGCLGIPVFVLNGKLKGVFNLFVPKMLLISHGFFCFFVVFFSSAAHGNLKK